jgi:hypothetical protein
MYRFRTPCCTEAKAEQYSIRPAVTKAQEPRRAG